MKIVQLTKAFSDNGGAGSYVRRLCPALEAAGHEVAVIHADESVERSQPAQFYVRNFDLPGPEAAVKARDVFRILQSQRPDVVHIQDNNNYFLEELVARSFPFLKTFHVYDFCPSGNKYHHAAGRACGHATGAVCVPDMVFKRCLLTKRPGLIWQRYRHAETVNRHARNYSFVTVASEFVRAQAVISGYSPDRVFVVPYFVNLPESAPPVDPASHSILFSARIVPEKGWRLLLKMLDRLNVNPSWVLKVAGDGPELEIMKAAVRRKNWAGRVKFLGWQDEAQMQTLYREARLAVIPSVWPEPFGIVGIEAMSHARPVVAFRAGGIPEWLEDGRTGILAPLQDVNAMAAAIQRLLNLPAEAAAFGSAGRESCARRFSAANHLEILTALYRQAAHRRPAENNLNVIKLQGGDHAE